MSRQVWAAVALLAAMLPGCTYQGAVDQAFHKPSVALQAEHRIPLRLAIVASSAVKQAAFRTNDDISIRIGDGLVAALAAELRGVFDAVTVVDEPVPGKAEHDIFAFLQVMSGHSCYETLRGCRTIRDQYELAVEVTLKDTNLRRNLGVYRNYGTFVFSSAAEDMAAVAAMGFSLMLLTPVALPAAQAAKASHATEGVQRAIGDGVRAIRAKILADGNLRDHTVASVAPRPPAEPGAATPAPRGEPYARVDSAYDGFLDSVVVIRAGRSFGTGFFVSGDGLIVTNHHVVEEGASIAVRLRSGKTLLARIVAEHRGKDLALLRVAETGQPWLKLSRGKELKLGGEVIAIGTPQGLSWSISRGIVSAVRDRSTARLIQTDAAINAGNSGGPLIDLGSGMVIGVNTLGIRKDVAEGLNFAVSSEDTLRAFPMLAKP